MKVIVIGGFLLCVVILFAGFVLEFLGFYKRTENNNSYMDNDEFDYGHDVNHEDNESMH